jgi:hypothetical protein
MNRRPTPPRLLRFPCGHVEDEPAVTPRTRGTPRAAWVACRRCNLIAVTIAPAKAPAGRRAAGAPTR